MLGSWWERISTSPTPLVVILLSGPLRRSCPCPSLAPCGLRSIRPNTSPPRSAGSPAPPRCRLGRA
eukprot:7954858-Prorocentrum_lima.AAC.1